MRDEHLRVVVSGAVWMGNGLGSIESALYQLFTQANDEVVIVAFAVSTATPMLFQQLTMMLQRGIRIRCLINRFLEQPQNVQRQFLRMKGNFPRLLEIYSFVAQNNEADLHAKIIIVDRNTALVGSANLSMRGLMDNHELGVIIEGVGALDVVKAVDQLFTSAFVFPIS